MSDFKVCITIKYPECGLYTAGLYSHYMHHIYMSATVLSFEEMTSSSVTLLD